jgi:hypothetical protein
MKVSSILHTKRLLRSCLIALRLPLQRLRPTVQRLLRPVGQLQRAEDLMSFQWILPTVSEVHDLNNFWIQMKAAEPWTGSADLECIDY